MREEKHPVFQGLMDTAYDRYKASEPETWTKDAILLQSVGDEVFAIALGNFNYQVENGGIMQWIGNEYATDLAVSALKVALLMIGTESAKQTSEIIEEAIKIGLKEPFSGSWDADDDDTEWAQWRDALGKLDSRYYDINDQLIDDVEAFFSKRRELVKSP
jgi:hypothetical protein